MLLWGFLLVSAGLIPAARMTEAWLAQADLRWDGVSLLHVNKASRLAWGAGKNQEGNRWRHSRFLRPRFQISFPPLSIHLLTQVMRPTQMQGKRKRCLWGWEGGKGYNHRWQGCGERHSTGVMSASLLSDLLVPPLCHWGVFAVLVLVVSHPSFDWPQDLHAAFYFLT